MDPLTAYRQKQQMQQQRKKKTPNYLGLYIAVGSIILLGLLIFWVSRDNQPRKTPTKPAEVTADVNLSETQKRSLYISLNARKEMLRPMGATQRAYETLAQEYRVSVGGVHAIEAEGNSKGWPKR